MSMKTAPECLRIDVHGHYFPAAYLDMLDGFGGPETGTVSARVVRGSGSDEELASRFAMMDRAGIDMQILSAAPQLPYFQDRNHAVSAARFINDSYAGIVARHPDRFAAYAVTPLPHVDACLKEMTRALDTLGMVGVTMGTSVLGRSIVDPVFDPFWEELNRREAILFLHPSGTRRLLASHSGGAHLAYRGPDRGYVGRCAPHSAIDPDSLPAGSDHRPAPGR